MISLYIIGKGGAANEIVQLIEQINLVKPTFDIKGFVVLERESEEITLYGKHYNLHLEAEFLETHQLSSVVIAHGTASIRAKIFDKFSEFKFPNIIHPSIDIHRSVKIGKGNIIKIGCLITTNINIGNNNYINRGVQIGHNVNIGNNNVLNPGSIISGGVQIGGENNFGANATVLQYLKIGNGNTLGAGAVLIDNVTQQKVLVGIPAKEKN